MNARECPRCGNFKSVRAEQCTVCDERDERDALEDRLDVMLLNGVETLEELKAWIKEHLLLRPQ